MNIERKQRQYKRNFCLFVVLCTILFLLSLYLQQKGDHILVGMILNLLFFLMTLIGAWGFWKHRALRLSNMYLDSVTGGMNEILFQERFEEELHQMEGILGFLYVNIKKFTVFNVEYGREKGDEILKKAYDAMKDSLLPGEHLARINADTFYVLMRVKDAEDFIRRIYELENGVYYISVPMVTQKVVLSMGGYLVQKPSDTYAHVVECANFCRTESPVASDAGTHYEIYDYTLKDNRKREKELREMLEPALEQGHLKLFLQPKYELKHETLAEAEALVRWIDPVSGMIPVGEFIPIFEKCGFMRQIDYFIFEEVLCLLEKWMDEGKEPIKISVNLSKSHFLEDIFFEKKFMPIFQKHRVPANLIEFEISESLMMDQEGKLLEFVKKLQRLGFSCSMDDFGSGYSSLNMLKSLPVTVIKLDQKMFREEEKERGKIVSRGIIRIAKELNMKVVAEGVETREYVDFLKEQGCDMIQGFYFGKPMPVEKFETYMN